MGTIKVKFKDGSSADIDEKYLDKAKQAGATVDTASKPMSNNIKVRFKDGSEAQISSEFKDKAVAAGATLIDEEIPSKKKDFSLQSQISSVEDLPIGENISDQESQSISGTTDDKTNRILSRAVAPNVSKKEIKPPLKPIVLEPKEGEISITANGNKFVISPERLPAEYPKTREGALKYAQDKSTSLLTNSINKNSESYIQTVKDVAKISELRRLENNSSVVSQKDVAKINQLLGTKIESVDEDILQLLKDKKKQLEQKRLFPDEGTTPNLLELNKDINLVSSLIKKAGNNLQKEQIGNGEVPVLQGDVRSDLKAAFSGMENEAKEYLQRINMENVSNEMATGLEALRYTDPLEYERLKSRIKEGKTISSAKAAQLVNSGASIIDARNLESLEKGEIDLDEYARKKQDIAKKVDENFYKRPDILQKQVAEVIAEHYAKKSNPILGKWYVTDREIDAVPEEEFELAGIDISRPEVQSVIKNIKKNEGILPFDNAIQKDDLMREAAKGFSQPIRGAVNTISGIGISNEQKRLQSELTPISNYVRKRTKYFDKNYGGIADAFNGLWQFVSQYLLMEGTVGLFKGIGKGLGGSTATTLVKTPEAIETMALREGNKLGNYIIDKSQLWGQLAVPFISTYDDYYKSALEKTDNPLAATASAFVNASMEALSEQMFDNVKFGRQVIKNFNNSVANIENIAKIFDKGVWDEVTQKEFKKTIKEGFENALKATAKGTVDLTKEAFEEIPVAFTNFVTDALVNPKSVENRDVLEEMKDSFLSGLVSFSIPSLIGVGGRLNKEFNNNTTQSDALMIAARNRDSVVDAIYNDFENGNLTQSDVNEKMKILNESSYALKRLPERYITGNPMEEGDKSKYLGLSVKENLLRSQNKSLEKDDPIYKANEETIKKINQEKNKILNKEGEEDNTDEETKLSPEEAIKKAADEGVLTGVEGEMIKNGTITPEHGLFELAKQKYGVSDDGTVFPEGGRDISMKTSLDVDAAVTDAFPTKESVISEIKKQAKQTATTEGLKEGEQPTVSESGEVENKTGLVLYHGSPHSFENFDISKLGSGEGAQAFGHGLYFTNEVDIAKGYANKLGSRKNFWEALQNGQELSLSKEDYEFINKEIDALGFDGGRAESEDLGTIIVDGKEEYAPAVLDAMSVLFGKNAKSEIEGYDLTKEQIDRLFTIKKKISDPQLYKVAVHEGKSPSEYDYIDWREPLTESQRKKIGGLREGTTGEQAYKILSKEFGGDQKASEFLLSKGIDGITYKSQKGTGGKTGEGRNYVVFDAKSIRVDEINEQKQLQEQKPSTVSEPLEGKGEVSTVKTKEEGEGSGVGGEPRNVFEFIENSGYERDNEANDVRYKKDGVTIGLSPNKLNPFNKGSEMIPKDEKGFTINIIATDQSVRGKGEASKALKEITDYADKNGETIYLSANDATIGFKKGLNKKQLEEWYSRHGFEKDESIMVRKPKPVEQSLPTQSKATVKTKEEENLTPDEKSEWSSLSMQEKLQLAKENLPDVISSMTDKEVSELADENAKRLLKKMQEQGGFVPANQIFNAIDEATQSKFRKKDKAAAVEQAMKQYGEKGIKALAIHRNFDAIIKQLIKNNKLESKC